MSRYIGPKLKITRRLGVLPGLTQKVANKRHAPGQHGQKSKKASPYAIRLMEKQKLRYHYGVGEKQLFNYLKKARKSNRSTAEVLLELLEMRLDNIVYRSGFVKSIDAAKQLINHGHICVNGQKVSIPSYGCHIHDRITFAHATQSSINTDLVPQFLQIELDSNANGILVRQMPDRLDIGVQLNELLIIEYYSKN